MGEIANYIENRLRVLEHCMTVLPGNHPKATAEFISGQILELEALQFYVENVLDVGPPEAAQESEVGPHTSRHSTNHLKPPQQ